MSKKQSEIELSNDELQAIHNARERYNQLMIAIGEVHVEMCRLQPEVDRLKNEEKRLFNELVDLRAREQDIASLLSQKYGDGRIDLEKKVFVPAKSEK